MPKEKEQVEIIVTDSVPEWMTTFSDCMTLLLCFFVMLLSFSSFDEPKARYIVGACQSMNLTSMFPSMDEPRDTDQPEDQPPVDATKDGSLKPEDPTQHNTTSPPPAANVYDSDAFKSHRTLYIPSDEMFWGEGAGFREGGTATLNDVAAFLSLLETDVHVVICESRSVLPAEVNARSLDRSWVIMGYLMDRSRLSPDHFSISATDTGAAKRFASRPVVEITILHRRAAS